MTTLGNKLQTAREERGWSVEFVSFRSRIQANIIEHLEMDDYAIFSSSAYVRSFLRKYCDLLDLQLEREISLIRDPEKPLLDHPTARENVRENMETTEFAPRSQRFRKAGTGKGSPVFLVGSFFILLTGLATFYYLGSQAGRTDGETISLFEQFESKLALLSRDRDTVEPLLDGETVAQMTPGTPVTTPMATTAGPLIKEISSKTGYEEIRKPDLRSFSPLSGAEPPSFMAKEPRVRARSENGVGLDTE